MRSGSEILGSGISLGVEKLSTEAFESPDSVKCFGGGSRHTAVQLCHPLRSPEGIQILHTVER